MAVSPRISVLLIIAVVVALTSACVSGTGSTPTAVISGDIAQGQRLFQERCASCHTSSSPFITPNDLASIPPDEIRETVRNGIPNAMPAFSESDLSDQQVNDIIAYLKSLQGQ